MQGWGRQGLLQGQGEACRVAGKFHEAAGPFPSSTEVEGEVGGCQSSGIRDSEIAWAT